MSLLGVSIFKLGDTKASWIETSECVAVLYFSVVAFLDVGACWSLQMSSVCSSANPAEQLMWHQSCPLLTAA